MVMIFQTYFFLERKQGKKMPKKERKIIKKA